VSWNDGLDSNQIAAASYNGTHARLIAGPGTGKTLTLIRRIIYLIEELNIDPEKIVILAFTRTAKREIFRSLRTLSSHLKIYPNWKKSPNRGK
jgi:DNA helicase-2/ATP-dependent DNA helicase PcrA